jgi:hypothetical protein
VPTNDALETLALGCRRNLYVLADHELCGLDRVADLEVNGAFGAELLQLTALLAARPEMALLGLAQFLGLAAAELNGIIAVLFDGPYLRDDAGINLQQSDRNDGTVRPEPLRHADFFSDDEFHSFLGPLHEYFSWRKAVIACEPPETRRTRISLTIRRGVSRVA